MGAPPHGRAVDDLVEDEGSAGAPPDAETFAITQAGMRGNTTYEAIVENRLKTCPAGRFADPGECGDLIAYICGAQAGFMTGQNIVNDGGVYQGLF